VSLGRHGLEAVVDVLGEAPLAECWHDEAVELVHPAGRGPALPFRLTASDVRDQGQEELEPGSVGGSGVEFDASGKQCCPIKALHAFSLAFSPLSCTISLSSRFILSACCLQRCSNCSIRCS